MPGHQTKRTTTEVSPWNDHDQTKYHPQGIFYPLYLMKVSLKQPNLLFSYLNVHVTL